MNAATIINENMTLDEKLEAIDKAMITATIKAAVAGKAPVDPASLTSCDGCQ